jgi:hypothetical protein
MERPLKRIRISDPEYRSPRDPGSQLAEGLFTSEMGIRSDETDSTPALPTRTIDLKDLQRRGIAAPDIHRIPLYPRNELVPRADTTVTANVIEVNVGDGTATSVAATVTASSGDIVVSLEDLPTLTVPASGDTTSAGDSSITESQTSSDTITSSRTTSTDTTSSTASGSGSLTDSTFSGNGTITSSDSIVTVTATSTLDVAYLNGTFVTTSFSIRPTKSDSDRTSTRSNAPSGIGVESSSQQDSSTGYYGAGGTIGPDSTFTASGPPSSSSSSDSGGGGGGGGPGLSPEQQTVVGGVVGGIAGLAIVLLVLLAFLRWYRNRLKARGELPEQLAQRNFGLGGPGHHHTLSQRSSGVPLTSALAASLRKFRPISSHTQTTTHTASTIPESEKGFQRIAGRKIAPVLSTGGDGFGGNYGAFEKEIGSTSHTRNERSLAGSSFYHDSNGFYGGTGRNSLPSSPTTANTMTTPRTAIGPTTARDFAAPGRATPDLLDDFPKSPSQVSLPSSRPEGLAALRPSPARTPVTISPAASSIGLPIQHNASSMQMSADTPPVPSLDAIGRSLAREDGSRVSRNSAKSGTSGGRGSRFNENIT